MVNAASPSFLEPTIPNQMNLFTYCSNNPIANIDSNGKFALFIGLLIGAVIEAAVNVVSKLASDVMTNLADDDDEF